MCVAGKGHPPSALPGLVEGKEEGSEERQKQIFNLSHLLGGDPWRSTSPQTVGGTEQETNTHRQALLTLTLDILR